MRSQLRLATLGFTSLVSAAAFDKRQSAAVSTSPPSGWTYQGCYSDSVSSRVLSATSYSSGSSMTEDSCIAYCTKAGYTVAGVEYASECYCDFQLASASVKEPDSDCNMPCSGNSAQLCGAGNRLTVFATASAQGPSTNPGPSGWVSLGCYTDVVSTRTLQYSKGVPAGASGMTVAQCSATCKTYGFQYAGLEYSQECYCDNIIRNAATVSSGCNMLCSGNSSEYCGGSNRLNLYQVQSVVTATAGVSAGWLPMGCVTDNVLARTLSSGQAVPGGYTNMTVENCLNVCENAGYNLAGLEYSQECFCDNQLENGGSCADQSTCNMPCNGNNAETCGGPNRLNVYQYGSSGPMASSCPASVSSTTALGSSISTGLTLTSTRAATSSAATTTPASTSVAAISSSFNVTTATATLKPTSTSTLSVSTLGPSSAGNASSLTTSLAPVTISTFSGVNMTTSILATTSTSSVSTVNVSANSSITSSASVSVSTSSGVNMTTSILATTSSSLVLTATTSVNSTTTRSIATTSGSLSITANSTLATTTSSLSMNVSTSSTAPASSSSSISKAITTSTTAVTSISTTPSSTTTTSATPTYSCAPSADTLAQYFGVYNPDFESGSVSPWAVSVTPSGAATVSVVAGYAYHGCFSLAVTPKNPGAQGAVSVTISQQSFYTFWEAGSAYYSVSYYGALNNGVSLGDTVFTTLINGAAVSGAHPNCRAASNPCNRSPSNTQPTNMTWAYINDYWTAPSTSINAGIQVSWTTAPLGSVYLDFLGVG